ncbi:prostate and testis expressed protein 2-like [Gracilinanus agilis]|uniref:prostate and testis expressed protein 2-like n=1 Tax=Gracilinanus agilis TaxID=191870 RepID=UPI001CFC8FBB|nr:prostate and testis expressed protein 2-like [Gracilinanus agilis]
MVKMFLLGLSLFCLLRGGEPNFGKTRREVLCSTCEHFKRGACYKNEGTCVTKRGAGCRTRSYYSFINRTDGWSYTHTKLDCVENCGETVEFLAAYHVVNICCSDRNKCNEDYSLA